MTIAAAFERRKNNFDLLRLLAALMVLWSHSYALTGADEPILRLTQYDTGGKIGVTIFFAISGFLVCKSVGDHPTGDYVLSRVLRIVPALILVTAFEVLLLGPLLTRLPLAEYFSHPATLDHLRNPLVFGISFFLPGVFETLADKGVNGSLWTLPVECGFYLLLPLLAVCWLTSRRGIILAILGVAGAYAYAVLVLGLGPDRQGAELWSGALTYPALRNGIVFLVGAAMWVHRAAIPLNAGMAACCAAILVIASGRTGATVAYFTCVPYLVLYLALARPLPFDIGKRLGDISYGTYLYAFPIQQTIIFLLGDHARPTLVSLIATPLALAFAILSWKLVEKPALTLRHQLRRRTAVPTFLAA